MSSNESTSSSSVLGKIDDVIATLDTASFTYESVTLGLLLTSDKQYFRVPQGVENDTSFIYYRNNAGSPVEVGTLAGGKAITQLKEEVQNLWDQTGKYSQQTNLFDYESSEDGFYVDTVGGKAVNASYFVSARIPVLQEQNYIFKNSVGQLAFYDINGKFLSYLPGVSGGVTFISPKKAFSLIFSQTISTNKKTQMLVKGKDLPSAYTAFGLRDEATQDRRTHYQIMSILKYLQQSGINLFDKSRINCGYALSTNGSLTSNVNYFTTDYIPVKPRTLYIANESSSVAVYYNADYEKTKVSAITRNCPFLIPEDAVYLRFQQSPLTSADVLMVVAGEVLPESYAPFGSPTSKNLFETSLTNARKAVEQSQPLGRNIFDKKRARSGYSVSYVNGAISKTENFFITDLMPVTPGGYFVSSYGTNSLCWYDVTGKFLNGSNSFSSSANQPILVPENAWYVQFQGSPIARCESLMVTQGINIPAGYVPFNNVSSDLPWQNKKIIWLGDSITLNGLYQPFVLAGSGMKQLANYGVAGQGVRTMADSITSNTISTADFISIFGGTNDYGANRPLGNISDARTDYDESVKKSFYYDVFYVLNKILTLKPTVRIVFSTPLKRCSTSGQVSTSPMANGAGHCLDDYVRAIKDVCGVFSTPVCDLFNTSGINAYNLSLYTGDNLHPNEAGSELHSRAMISSFNAS